MVATSQPRVAVRSRQQRINLRPRQKADQRARLPLVGNRQHALDQAGVLRHFERSKAEERSDRSQTQVTAPSAVCACILQVIQECPQERRVQVFHRQPGWCSRQSFLSKLQ
jgi:hypothetical protein